MVKYMMRGIQKERESGLEALPLHRQDLKRMIPHPGPIATRRGEAISITEAAVVIIVEKNNEKGIVIMIREEMKEEKEVGVDDLR